MTSENWNRREGPIGKVFDTKQNQWMTKEQAGRLLNLAMADVETLIRTVQVDAVKTPSGLLLTRKSVTTYARLREQLL